MSKVTYQPQRDIFKVAMIKGAFFLLIDIDLLDLFDAMDTRITTNLGSDETCLSFWLCGDTLSLNWGMSTEYAEGLEALQPYYRCVRIDPQANIGADILCILRATMVRFMDTVEGLFEVQHNVLNERSQVQYIDLFRVDTV